MSIYQTPEPPKKSVIPMVVVVAGIVTVLCGAMLMVVMLRVAPSMPAPKPAPAAVLDTASATPSASPSPTPAKPTTAATVAAQITHAAPPPAPLKPQAPRTRDLYPVTALGSQAAIDRGNLVTWMTSPTCLLAGHDNMGWAFLNSVPTGTVVVVHTGPCAGNYRIVAHNWQSVKGGAVPGWMSSYALVLQSCTGAVGMGFSMAQRI